MPDDRSDAQITEALVRAPADAWDELWRAMHALAEEDTFATWAGGDVVGTTVVDGEERLVHQMPYPVYADSVERVRAALGQLGLAVPFDWMSWDDLSRYRDDPAALADAPTTDAVRMLIAIQRSERFTDGSIDAALTSGLMQTALERLRRWYDTEWTSSPSVDPG